MLPFTFGKFQQGDRYVNDIGYYWALSDYTDLKTSFDYHEKNKTIIFKGNFNFNKIYSLNGNISGHFSRETGYDYSIAEEVKRSRWIARGRYNHNITPTFKVTANADFQSDKTYYNDLSQNLNERLNRLTKSRLNFTKRFGKSTSLSGEISHTVNLDLETRTDLFPNLSLTLPTIYLFGKGKQDAQGKLKQNWFNKLTFRYSPRMTNYSNRVSPIDTIVTTLDTLGNILSADTTRFRSRKKYTRISHNPALNLPTLKLFKYFSLTPRVSYSETWYKIHETDQSIAAGIDASTTYRTYSYNAGASFKTNLYGIVRPNLFGVKAVRHVLTPIISYSYSPDIDLYPDVRSFAGGGAGSRKTSSVSVTLSQLFQAKVGEEEKERNLNLLSFSSSFRYNFLAEGKSFSTLSSNFQSSALKYISFDGTLQHSLYDPDTDEKRVLSPVLLSFSLNARMTLFGKRFLFDEMIHDPASGQRDSARINNSQNLSSQNNYASRAKTNSKGWSMSATYSFSESGRLENYFKRSFLRFNLNFNLTNSTSIAYSQSYDFSSGRTVNSSVNIIRTIHCWSGSLYWVPSGSNRGFGFKLFVTALPEIKLDNAHDNFLKGVQR